MKVVTLGGEGGNGLRPGAGESDRRIALHAAPIEGVEGFSKHRDSLGRKRMHLREFAGGVPSTLEVGRFGKFEFLKQLRDSCRRTMFGGVVFAARESDRKRDRQGYK